MPIRRPNNDDFMARRMDKRLSEMEASISNIYGEASEEATRKLERYLERFEERDAVMYARYVEEEITEDEWLRWRANHMLRTQRYEAVIDSVTDVLVNADISAMALIDGNLPYVIAQSFNFSQFVGNIIAEDTGLNVASFQIYNTRSVQALIRDNPQLLPVVDIPRDRQWNRSHINTAVTQGIIQGDSMDRIASRLQTVVNMDDNAAIRNARTAVTAAENMGRNESYNFIRSQGIDMVKEWSATLDSRTRDTHLLLNGTRPNEDGFFGDGILHPNYLMQYPADPNGEPQERYNCRCRLNIVPPEYSREANERNYEEWMRSNYPEDWAEVQEADNRIRSDGTSRNQQRQNAINRVPEARERVTRRLEERLEAERGGSNANWGTNYAGVPYTRQEYENRLQELNEFSNYHYHATTINAINGIKRDGLKPSRGHMGEGVYMARTADSALEWTESTSTGGGIVLRVSNEYLARTDYSNIERGIQGEGFTERTIPAEYIQIRLSDGSWISIEDAVISYVRGVPHVIRRPRGR